jgi:hypothetical protein
MLCDFAPLGLVAPDDTVPYGTVLSKDGFPGTPCQAMIAVSLRDALAAISQQHLSKMIRWRVALSGDERLVLWRAYSVRLKVSACARTLVSLLALYSRLASHFLNDTASSVSR